jgi:polar amino acid transport system ATP-binding protein
MRPALLLLDEVTSALDPTLVGEVLDLLSRISPNQGTTMLIATHEMNFARDVAHQVVYPRSRASSSNKERPRRSLTNPRHHATRAFLGRVR